MFNFSTLGARQTILRVVHADRSKRNLFGSSSFFQRRCFQWFQTGLTEENLDLEIRGNWESSTREQGV